MPTVRGTRTALVVIGLVSVALPAAHATSKAPSCHGQDATIVGSSGSDTLRGTAGRDVIHSGGGRDVICAGTGFDQAYGGPRADRIWTGNGGDRLNGGAGDDRFVGGVNTGYGVDRAVYATAAERVRVNRDTGRVVGQGIDRLRQIWVVVGSPHADVMKGLPSRAEDLLGGPGADRIYGYGGIDGLYGLKGADHICGGD